MAPEVLWRDYDISADIWSAGVVLYILLCGRPPFNGRNDEEIVTKVRTGELHRPASPLHGEQNFCSRRSSHRSMLAISANVVHRASGVIMRLRLCSTGLHLATTA